MSPPQRRRNDKVRKFWSWFETIADRLATNFENPTLLAELDSRVSSLGDVAWEIGPGTHAENALVISPDGRVDLLPLTQRIVASAPTIPGWEFLPARPPRVPPFEFSIQSDGDDASLEVDAHEWQYVLFRRPRQMFDIILEQPDLVDASDGDRYTAAVVLLDGLLGEAARLRLIHGVEPVAQLPADLEGRSNPVADLTSHIAALGRGA